MADVIGSAEIEIRATTRQLKSDLSQAEKVTKAELKKVEIAAKDAQRELKRAFSDAGQTEFERAMRVIRNASDHTEAEVTAAAQRVARDLKGRYRDMGADMGRSLMGVSRTAQIAFAAITAYSLKLAADAGEIESAFEVAFGTATDGARKFSDTLSDEVGRDAVVLREQMTRLQLVLTGTGVAAQTSAEMVKALTTAGVDAGSLFNTSDAEALQKIISGLTEKTEPLKAFGVVISQTAVEAELLRLGFKGNASEATEAAKSIARANLIIKGLSVAQGDAARTADSAANTTKRMGAEFNKAARDLGTQLLPVMVKVFGAATNVLKVFNDLPGGVQVAGLAFLGLIAAGGPIAGLLINLGRVIKLAKETRAALIAASLAGGGAGAAGGAAAGYGAGRFAAAAPTIAAVAGVVSLSGDTQRPTGPGPTLEQQATAAQAQLNRLRDRGALTPGNARSERIQRQTIARYEATVATLQGRLRAQQNAALESAAAAGVVGQAQAAGLNVPGGVDTSVAGGFSLPAGLQNGAGGARGGGRTGRSAPQTDIEAMRQALEIQNALDVARAAGNETQIRALTRQQDLVRLTADFQRAGYTDAADRAEEQVSALDKARDRSEQMARWAKESSEFWEQVGINADKAADAAALLSDQTLDRLGYELELARLGGSEGMLRDAERRLFIETRTLEILRLKLAATEAEARAMAGGEFANLDAAAEGREMAQGMVSLLRSEDIWEEAGRRFKDAAWDNIENLFAQLFKGMNGKGDGGWLAAIGSAIFGGGRAAGGQMTGGNWYRVGEHGPENIVMPRDGFAIPNGGMPGGGGQSQNQKPGNTYYLSGNLMTPEFWRMIETGDVRAANIGAQRGMAGAVGFVEASAPRQQKQQRAYKG